MTQIERLECLLHWTSGQLRNNFICGACIRQRNGLQLRESWKVKINVNKLKTKKEKVTKLQDNLLRNSTGASTLSRYNSCKFVNSDLRIFFFFFFFVLFALFLLFGLGFFFFPRKYLIYVEWNPLLLLYYSKIAFLKYFYMLSNKKPLCLSILWKNLNQVQLKEDLRKDLKVDQ